MALIDSFVGRASPVTCKPVHVSLWRFFNPKTLQDVYKVEFVSGSKHEVYDKLTHSQAMSRFQAAQRWWL